MTQTFDPRRAEPGQEFTWHGPDGAAHHMKADADGVLDITSADQETVADAFGLPVARKAIAEKKAAVAAKED